MYVCLHVIVHIEMCVYSVGAYILLSICTVLFQYPYFFFMYIELFLPKATNIPYAAHEMSNEKNLFQDFPSYAHSSVFGFCYVTTLFF